MLQWAFRTNFPTSSRLCASVWTLCGIRNFLTIKTSLSCGQQRGGNNAAANSCAAWTHSSICRSENSHTPGNSSMARKVLHHHWEEEKVAKDVLVASTNTVPTPNFLRKHHLSQNTKKTLKYHQRRFHFFTLRALSAVARNKRGYIRNVWLRTPLELRNSGLGQTPSPWCVCVWGGYYSHPGVSRQLKTS